jgi:hypothetical protein
MRHRLTRHGHVSSHFRHQLAFLLSVVLMTFVEYGCSAANISTASTPTPAMSAKPSPTPTPTPTPIPVPSAAPATSPVGWVTTTSQNWCGYTFPQGNITGVRAQWTEPDVSNQVPGAYVVTWVGVGGWKQSYNNIVQIGTRAVSEGGQVVHDVWYETLPPNHWYSLGTISAGDSVAASVILKPGSIQQWDLSLVDLTTHQIFQTTVIFSSLRIYADYIVEDPDATSNNGPPYYPFPKFAPITISKADVRYTNHWLSIAAVAGLQVTLIQSNKTLALPSPLHNDTFTVKRILS